MKNRANVKTERRMKYMDIGEPRCASPDHFTGSSSNRGKWEWNEWRGADDGGVLVVQLFMLRELNVNPTMCHVSAVWARK